MPDPAVPLEPTRPRARPRVLLLITRAEPGGAQVHVRDLVAGLQSSVDFTVVTGEDGFLVEELRAIGVAVRHVPALRREVAPRTDARALQALRALIAELRPHLVHTHSTKAGLLGRMAARIEGVPVVHTAHAWSFSEGLPWRRRAWAIPVEAVAGRVTDRFIVVSGEDRALALRWRVARDRQVRVVHNGVPDTPHRAAPGGGDPPVLTMVARLAPPKDPALLLEALEGISAPFHLQLVGDGPLRAAVEADIRRRGLSDRVTLLGVRHDVPALLAQSHVFVLSSRQEGFPLSILEAMRAGLPVVASDVGGVSEAVEPDATGLLVPRGDAPAMRAALVRLLSSPEVRARMGEVARDRWTQRFTLDHMLDATAQVYAELCPVSLRPRRAAGPAPASLGGVA